MRRAVWIAVLLLGLAPSARAETVEVAPGVQVTKTTFKVPANEQPFFGFIDKTPELRALDTKFVADITAAAGSREKAFEATVQRGWALLDKANYGEAGKRFNQASLLAPEQSAIFHGFAIIAIARFNDPVFAEELFKIAKRQPAPVKALSADYGRLLLIAKRPAEALPELEQATRETPNLADAWSNLGFARFQTGDAKAACAAVTEAEKRKPSLNVASDLNVLRRQASCP